PIDVAVRNECTSCGADRVGNVSIGLRIGDCPVNFGQSLLGGFRSRYQGGNLLLFLNLPVDELLDIRMIDVDDDHLGGAAGGAAGLDGAGSPVTDLQERH